MPRIKERGTDPLVCRGDQFNCLSYNYGYQAGLYALQQARLAAANSPEWWLDVEAVNSWTNSLSANRADIKGMIDAIESISFLRPKIGIYTASNQWVALVGHWNIGLPLWLGTGSTTQAGAKQACTQKSVTGGKIVLTQYTVGQLDYNYACNSLPSHKYF